MAGCIVGGHGGGGVAVAAVAALVSVNHLSRLVVQEGELSKRAARIAVTHRSGFWSIYIYMKVIKTKVYSEIPSPTFSIIDSAAAAILETQVFEMGTALSTMAETLGKKGKRQILIATKAIYIHLLRKGWACRTLCSEQRTRTMKMRGYSNYILLLCILPHPIFTQREQTHFSAKPILSSHLSILIPPHL
jgi:hypothetical protein